MNTGISKDWDVFIMFTSIWWRLIFANKLPLWSIGLQWPGFTHFWHPLAIIYFYTMLYSGMRVIKSTFPNNIFTCLTQTSEVNKISNILSYIEQIRGHPLIRGNLLGTVSYLPHVKEPVMKGQLLCDIEVSIEDKFCCIALFACAAYFLWHIYRVAQKKQYRKYV